MSLSRRELFNCFFRPLRRSKPESSSISERVVSSHVVPASAGPASDRTPRTRLGPPKGGTTYTGSEAPPSNGNAAPIETKQVAVIQGRYCLAYQSFCSVCVERCPVEGAIAVHDGIPRVVANTCTGCSVCHDVCPAPVNAVLMIQRK